MTPAEKAAREFTNDGLGQGHFIAGWNACASFERNRGLTADERQAMSDAIYGARHNRWHEMADAAYSALQKLRAPPSTEQGR